MGKIDLFADTTNNGGYVVVVLFCFGLGFALAEIAMRIVR